MKADTVDRAIALLARLRATVIRLDDDHPRSVGAQDLAYILRALCGEAGHPQPPLPTWGEFYPRGGKAVCSDSVVSRALDIHEQTARAHRLKRNCKPFGKVSTSAPVADDETDDEYIPYAAGMRPVTYHGLVMPEPVTQCAVANGASGQSYYLSRFHEPNSDALYVPNRHPAQEALEDMYLLESGWNGLNAPAPDVLAVQRCVELLRMGLQRGMSDARPSPDVEGGVSIYFFGGGQLHDGGWKRHGAIMVSNDLEACLYLHDRSKPLEDAGFEDIQLDDASVEDALQRISRFIYG
jgi:hypothetical protein